MATAAAQNDPRHTLPLRDTRTQLFVANLPYRVRWQDLKDLFRRAGTVLRADVSLGPDNRSRGYGTVLLATAEDVWKSGLIVSEILTSRSRKRKSLFLLRARTVL
ncbi:hypothetical protein R3P38DRAFT_3017009 [Favolaschia claudopus]|uniref:RRM domain-containing protein n=1 Tax=Favolaschia claudopus TaxID=2862362 RepID=A0AAW0AJF9_9AGAR